MSHAKQQPLLHQIDWRAVHSLRLQARAVADGVYAGMHHSHRRGAGVEFGGYREYVVGDDMRWIDRRALMRHNRLMVRLFETETDRQLQLIVDATSSMSFTGKHAPASKFYYASLIAAALCRVALWAGDPVALRYIGGNNARPVALGASRDTFERVVNSLENTVAQGDASVGEQAIERTMQAVAREARRGATIVLLSDLLDLAAQSEHRFAALCVRRHVVVAAQVLDREELTLPYEGTQRFTSLEGNLTVETNPNEVRQHYQSALDDWTNDWTAPLIARGGKALRTVTDQDPVQTVLGIVNAVSKVSV